MKEDVHGGLEAEAMTRLVQSRPQEGHKTVQTLIFRAVPKSLWNSSLIHSHAYKRPRRARDHSWLRSCVKVEADVLDVPNSP